VSVRVSAVGLVVLVAALVRSWPTLVPVAIVLVCGGYAAELAIDDAPLDSSAPVVAAAVLLAAELAYWSLEEAERVAGSPGEDWRHAVFVAALGLGAFVVGALLVALVASVHTASLALDVTGALAAATTLAVALLLGAGRGRRRS
jgi:hypothetical protein